MIEDTQNKVEIIQLDEDKGDFVHCTYFDHEYPPSKIMWIPDTVKKIIFNNYRKAHTKILWQLQENT